jgi:hypothetical protein
MQLVFEREDTPDVKLKKLEPLLSQVCAETLADVPLHATLLSSPTDGFLGITYALLRPGRVHSI